MHHLDTYKKNKLRAVNWRVLEAIAAAGHAGTRKFNGWNDETYKLREADLIRSRYGRDGLRRAYATDKGKWWLHWHKAAGKNDEPAKPQPKQLSFI